MNFKLVSEYSPTGDQPEAISSIVKYIEEGVGNVTLHGVTGSGKTYTMANVIERLNRPTLILSHNKTLAAQLYNEFKTFFPENSVQYFVSYYDYYQPEAFIPKTNTYIEKDLSINDEIEKLRISTSAALLSGRRDVIVIATVSCIYGIGNPEDFNETSISLSIGDKISRTKLMFDLSTALYHRTENEFTAGSFRMKGDAIDIFLSSSDSAYRIRFFGDEIESIQSIDPIGGNVIERQNSIIIRPSKMFVTTKERIKSSVREIQDDLFLCYNDFVAQGKLEEAARLKSRVEYDLEMIKEVGYCSGIENYSRYFDGRKPGTRPFCLIDYFPKDFLTFIDESHVTVSQVGAMFGGDFSRKSNLVEYGFRLPSAFDNRPLKFAEFESLIKQTVFVSATPANYELERSEGLVVEQFIRPTGLLDPEIEIIPTVNQIDTIFERINIVIEKDQRVLITTLTKRMAEELAKFLEKSNIRCRYIHSDIDNMERVAIIEDYRAGLFDVLIGVNLLREGLDMPEVSLVIIMNADKEGFLRSERSMTQTAGRAARNIDGHVIMFADKITKSMQQTIQAANLRREKQIKYNQERKITPKQITKDLSQTFDREEKNEKKGIDYRELNKIQARMVASRSKEYFSSSKEDLQQEIEKAKEAMTIAAKKLDFATATIERDRMREFEKELEKLTKGFK